MVDKPKRSKVKGTPEAKPTAPYIILSGKFHHERKPYGPGETIDLTDTQAAAFGNAIKPAATVEVKEETDTETQKDTTDEPSDEDGEPNPETVTEDETDETETGTEETDGEGSGEETEENKEEPGFLGKLLGKGKED